MNSGRFQIINVQGAETLSFSHSQMSRWNGLQPRTKYGPKLRAQSGHKDTKTGVLFMQSQEGYGSVSSIHGMIMAHLDRRCFTVHAACTTEGAASPSSALSQLSRISGLTVRPTNFGPGINASSRTSFLDGLRRIVPATYSLCGLVPYVRRNRIRIIHTTEKPRDAFYGLLLSRVTGAKLVVHLHVKVDDWLSPLSRRAMGRAHGLIAVSEFVAESARVLGYPPDRVFCALNALDTNRWDPNADGSKLRGELRIPEEVPLVALIANVLPWKGHALLLRALGKLHDVGRNFRLIIVGDIVPQIVASGGSSYLQELQALVRSLNLTDCVSFLGFRGDVMELLAASDVFALPSFEEPFGLAYLEAMAMAKPVLGLKSGGAPEVIVDGETGLLSDPEDVDGLAHNLAALINNRELRSQMGRAGRRRVEGSFSPSRLARDTEEIYRHVLRLGSDPSLATRSQATAKA